MTPQQIDHHLRNVTSATFVSAEADDPNVFAFVAAFPGNIRINIYTDPLRTNQEIDPENAPKTYAARIVDGLFKRGLDGLVTSTNWASATAAIQRICVDFNDKRAGRMPRPDIDTILAVRSILDNQDVPKDGRQIWPPVTTQEVGHG